MGNIRFHHEPNPGFADRMERYMELFGIVEEGQIVTEDDCEISVPYDGGSGIKEGEAAWQQHTKL